MKRFNLPLVLGGCFASALLICCAVWGIQNVLTVIGAVILGTIFYLAAWANKKNL